MEEEDKNIKGLRRSSRASQSPERGVGHGEELGGGEGAGAVGREDRGLELWVIEQMLLIQLKQQSRWRGRRKELRVALQLSVEFLEGVEARVADAGVEEERGPRLLLPEASAVDGVHDVVEV